MHAEKIRTAYMPAFSLEVKDVLILMGFVAAAAYLLGFMIGMMG